MSEKLFPSGPWIGFYTHHQGAGAGERHRMELKLTFADGGMGGEGADDVGIFNIRGRYDAASGDCHWTKAYVGAHEVTYHGFREGRGILGTWEIQPSYHGGFHIWPLSEGATAEESESAEETELAEVLVTGKVDEPMTAPRGD